MGEEEKKIEFVVGEQYENEKGLFTVLSKKRDEMVIRWDNGDETATSIQLQRRIAERRQWEKDNPPRAAGAGGKKGAARKKAAEAFAGLAPTDFKTSASGTRWRSRGQLGGAVAGQVKAPRLTLNSWAFSHKPEMHIQDARYRDGAADSSDARFFVRVDKEALYYGLRVARREDTPSQGDGFSKWVRQPESEETLRSLAEEYNLAARDRVSGDEASSGEPFSTCSSVAAGTDPFDLELFATLEKKKAVENGADIASVIAGLFSRLVPLYKAAVAG